MIGFNFIYMLIFKTDSLFFSLQVSLLHRARARLRMSVLSCKLADPVEASRSLSG